MGIPSSLLTWTNDIIAIKRKLRINATEFDQAINEVTIQIYRKGFDVRFQTSQTIPVVINELLTRLFYSIRRTIKYFQLNDSSQWNFNELWEACNPYSNASVGRMLTVSHATFELIDISDAVIRSYGTNNPIEFIVRLNLIGVGRLSVSIYGEVGYLIDREYRKRETDYHTRRRVLIESYIEDLKKLSKRYDDKEINSEMEKATNSGDYKTALSKSIELAELRGSSGIRGTSFSIGY